MYQKVSTQFFSIFRHILVIFVVLFSCIRPNALLKVKCKAVARSFTIKVLCDNAEIPTRIELICIKSMLCVAPKNSYFQLQLCRDKPIQVPAFSQRLVSTDPIINSTNLSKRSKKYFVAFSCFNKLAFFQHQNKAQKLEYFTVGPFALIPLIFRHFSAGSLNKFWTYLIIFEILLYLSDTFFVFFGHFRTIF